MSTVEDDATRIKEADPMRAVAVPAVITATPVQGFLESLVRAAERGGNTGVTVYVQLPSGVHRVSIDPLVPPARPSVWAPDDEPLPQLCQDPDDLADVCREAITSGIPLDKAVGHVMRRYNGRVNPTRVAEVLGEENRLLNGDWRGRIIS